MKSIFIYFSLGIFFIFNPIDIIAQTDGKQQLLIQWPHGNKTVTIHEGERVIVRTVAGEKTEGLLELVEDTIKVNGVNYFLSQIASIQYRSQGSIGAATTLITFGTLGTVAFGVLTIVAIAGGEGALAILTVPLTLGGVAFLVSGISLGSNGKIFPTSRFKMAIIEPT